MVLEQNLGRDIGVEDEDARTEGSVEDVNEEEEEDHEVQMVELHTDTTSVGKAFDLMSPFMERDLEFLKREDPRKLLRQTNRALLSSFMKSFVAINDIEEKMDSSRKKTARLKEAND